MLQLLNNKIKTGGGLLVSLIIFAKMQFVYAEENITFNTSLLDSQDKKNVDLSDFTNPDYIMPGTYLMMINVNNNPLSEREVRYSPSKEDPKKSVPCVTKEIVSLIGFKQEVQDKLKWDNNSQCLDLNSLSGVVAKGTLSNHIFKMEIPKELLEYTSRDWEPPSRWDNGIAGVLFDYNFNTQLIRAQGNDKKRSVTGNGTLGGNYGAWRVRAEWQGNYEKGDSAERGNYQEIKLNRIYAYRVLDYLKAKLTLGENSLYSSIFDGFNFTGAQLSTQDSMLPPSLRGYEPEVSGFARTNAKVTIYQDGRVIYESQVAPGNFHIQDLATTLAGKLDVVVNEQDGTVQKFQVNSATIPYLTRPGRVSYKLSGGEVSSVSQAIAGPAFTHGEFSWGVNNCWSLYGGVILSSAYNAFASGIGLDLFSLGAISLDLTHSMAKLPQDKNLSGNSLRINYTKRFDKYDSEITFAGYRFSERNYLTMSQFLDFSHDALNDKRNIDSMKSKQMYTVNFNKEFENLGLNAGVSFNHEEYWGNSPSSDYYTVSLRKYFDIGMFKNLSMNFSLYERAYAGFKDRGAYVNLSMPLDTNKYISYSGQASKSGTENSIGYSNQIDGSNNYQINASPNNSTVNGFYSHSANDIDFTASASHSSNAYDSAGFSFKGGATLTSQGGAFHRQDIAGGTRLMIDTHGVSGVPVHGYGPDVESNMFGKVIIGNINGGYKSTVKVDINELPKNADVDQSVIETTLSDGAIGFRKLDIVAGMKMMAVIKSEDGTYPPLGATVVTSENQQAGIIDEGGNVWLRGINPNESMNVEWAGKAQCGIKMPNNISKSSKNTLSLICKKDNLIFLSNFRK